MSTQLQQLVSDLSDELKIDPNKRINSQAILTRNINRAITRIQEDANYDLPENNTVATITLTGQEEDLADNFIRVAEPNSVKLGDNTPLFPTDYNALLGRYNLSQNSGQPNSYYVRFNGTNWVIGVYPSPTNGGTVTFPYLQRLSELSGDTDQSPLSTDYDEAIIDYAVYLTMRRIKGYEKKAAEYLAFYKEKINKITVNRLAYNRHSLRLGYERHDSESGISPKSFDDSIYG